MKFTKLTMQDGVAIMAALALGAPAYAAGSSPGSMGSGPIVIGAVEWAANVSRGE